jgi:hypothetical protein
VVRESERNPLGKRESLKIARFRPLISTGRK